MGALNVSRTDTAAPFDAFVTRKGLERLFQVALERLAVQGQSWTPHDSAYSDPADQDFAELRVTGKNYRYGAGMLVEADAEANELEVAVICRAPHQDVNVRWYALGADGSYHWLRLSGGTTATRNLTTITGSTGYTVYTWRLALGSLRQVRGSQFVLVMAVDAEFDTVTGTRYYRIWCHKQRDHTGMPKSWRLGLLEDAAYPVAPAAGYLTAFSTDWADQPVELRIQSRTRAAAGSVWTDATRLYPDFDQAPVLVGGLCEGDTTPPSAAWDDATPDMIWPEPYLGLRFLWEADNRRATALAATNHEYFVNHRIAAQGLGELRVSAMTVVGVSGTETVDGDEHIKEVFENSTVPWRNLDRARAALGPGRLPRALLVNRLVSMPQDSIWGLRTPIFDWGNQELEVGQSYVETNSKFEIFRSDLERALRAEDLFYREGDATLYARQYARIRFMWAWPFHSPVEPFQASVFADFYDVSGSLLGTETFAGALTVGEGRNFNADLLDTEGQASGGIGYLHRVYNVSAGREGPNDTSLSKTWPQSDYPHRFRGATCLADLKNTGVQMFQEDVPIPTGTSYIVVSVQPLVGATFFDDVPEAKRNVLAILHHDVRMSRATAWDGLGV